MQTEQDDKNKRHVSDRRQRQIPPLKYIIFGGRRRNIRRREDENKFIIPDVHGAGFFTLAILILTLSAFDGFLTLILIDAGASEINPLMSYLININFYVYLIIKCLLTGLGVIFFVVLRNYKSRIFGISISKLLPTTVFIFLIIIVYQLHLLFN